MDSVFRKSPSLRILSITLGSSLSCKERLGYCCVHPGNLSVSVSSLHQATLPLAVKRTAGPDHSDQVVSHVSHGHGHVPSIEAIVGCSLAEPNSDLQRLLHRECSKTILNKMLPLIFYVFKMVTSTVDCPVKLVLSVGVFLYYLKTSLFIQVFAEKLVNRFCACFSFFFFFIVL